MKRAGNNYYYHYNAHNDIIAMTNRRGKVVASYAYDAWGNILSQEGPLAKVNPYRYAGYRYDEETGLYYLNARYYNPEHGAFLSVDPCPGELEDIHAQNGYSYVGNNPVMKIDPTDEYAIAAWLLAPLTSAAVIAAAPAVGLAALGVAAGVGAWYATDYIREKLKSSENTRVVHPSVTRNHSRWTTKPWDHPYGKMNLSRGNSYSKSNSGSSGYSHRPRKTTADKTGSSGGGQKKPPKKERVKKKHSDSADKGSSSRQTQNKEYLNNKQDMTMNKVQKNYTLAERESMESFLARFQNGSRFKLEKVKDVVSKNNSLRNQINTKSRDIGNTGRGKNRLKYDPEAKGAHSTFKRDPKTGQITNYRTWDKSHPKNPSPFTKEKGYDGVGKGHMNSVTKQRVQTPHVHDPKFPGEVRIPKPYEIPMK